MRDNCAAILDHLPSARRADLRRALDILFASFDDGLKGKLSPQRKSGHILKVIL